MPGPLRRLLPPALSAVLATAVAVPVTWYLTDRHSTDPAAGPAPVAAGPANGDQLRARLAASLPDPDAAGAVLLAASPTGEAATGLPPGRYRVQLICGRLRVQAAVEAIRVSLRTPRQRWTIELPCPSTALTPDEELDFTGLAAGAVAAGLAATDGAPIGIMVLIRFVPVTGEAGGTDG